jgi:hypothetical protein
MSETYIMGAYGQLFGLGKIKKASLKIVNGIFCLQNVTGDMNY